MIRYTNGPPRAWGPICVAANASFGGPGEHPVDPVGTQANQVLTSRVWRTPDIGKVLDKGPSPFSLSVTCFAAGDLLIRFCVDSAGHLALGRLKGWHQRRHTTQLFGALWTAPVRVTRAGTYHVEPLSAAGPLSVVSLDPTSALPSRTVDVDADEPLPFVYTFQFRQGAAGSSLRRAAPPLSLKGSSRSFRRSRCICLARATLQRSS